MKQTIEHNWLQSDFEKFERTLNGQAGSLVHAFRRQAFAQFAAAGFPTTANEEWRFTNVEPIARGKFLRASATGDVADQDLRPFIIPDPAAIRLVFVDGFFAGHLSKVPVLPAGVRVESLAAALAADVPGVIDHLGSLVRPHDNGFTALNTAFLWDGAFISVPAGSRLEVPVHLLFLATGASEGRAIYPRNLIIAGAGADLSVVETYAGSGRRVYLTNAVTEMFLGTHATVEHDKLQRESPGAFHVGTSAIRQDAETLFASTTMNLGGALVRNTVHATLAGEGGDCTLNGLSLGTGGQLVDNHTSIDHAAPGCTSHELYKSVLDGRSRGVFNGKIFVRKDAQKTDAKQTNKTLLLSDDATIDTKPQLEIFADDVKCTHGATVGQLDEDQVFYLRARGIGEIEARDMLTFAFAGDVIDRVHVESLRSQLHGLVHQLLHEGRIPNDH